jgi:hypothetical protein
MNLTRDDLEEMGQLNLTEGEYKELLLEEMELLNLTVDEYKLFRAKQSIALQELEDEAVATQVAAEAAASAAAQKQKSGGVVAIVLIVLFTLLLVGVTVHLYRRQLATQRALASGAKEMKLTREGSLSFVFGQTAPSNGNDIGGAEGTYDHIGGLAGGVENPMYADAGANGWENPTFSGGVLRNEEPAYDYPQGEAGAHHGSMANETYGSLDGLGGGAGEESHYLDTAPEPEQPTGKAAKKSKSKKKTQAAVDEDATTYFDISPDAPGSNTGRKGSLKLQGSGGGGDDAENSNTAGASEEYLNVASVAAAVEPAVRTSSRPGRKGSLKLEDTSFLAPVAQKDAFENPEAMEAMMEQALSRARRASATSAEGGGGSAPASPGDNAAELGGFDDFDV